MVIIKAIATTSAVIASIVFLAISAVCCVGSIKLLGAAVNYKRKCEKIIKTTERRTRMEYNKIASLSPKELHSYLAVAFGRSLILCSDSDVAEKSPKAHETLYETALSRFMGYLGEETIAAIEYHYGKGYLTRWAADAYRVLEYENVASGIIDKKQTQANVASRIAAWQ